MQTISSEDFLKYQYFSALQVSPDAKSATFCLSQADKETNIYNNNLWCYSHESGAVTRVAGTEAVRNFCYLDGDRILFASVKGNGDQAYILQGGWLTVFFEKNIRTDELKELFRVPLKGATARPVNSSIFLVSSVRDNARPNIESMLQEKRNAALKKCREEEDFEVCDELPFVSDGRGFINKERHALYLYDVRKKTLCELTEAFFETSFSAISRDGKYIAFSGISYDRIFVRTHGVYLYNVETAKTTILLTPGSYQIMGLDFMGEELVVAAAPWNGMGPFPNHNLYTLALSGGEMQLQHRHSTEDFGNKTCSDCRYGTGMTFAVFGEYLYYLTTHDTSAFINRWKPGQSPQRLHDENFIPDSIAVGNNLVMATGTAGKGQELFSVEASSANCLSSINTVTLDKRMVSQPVKYQFSNSHGDTISGFVIAPVGYNPSERYPGILEIHGGPRASFTADFFHEMQYLSGKGYFVFFCNPRGSAGKGECFANLQACRGTLDYQDVMEWTDFVLEKYPAIDPNRLGVMGGSYGGYLTNWCITHTNRFSAAVSMRSISNIIGDFGATDYGVWGTLGVYGGTPWCREELLRQQSPYTYAMKVTTPTLFLHSFEDYRCTLGGAMQMYAALQINGIPTRMCLFRHANHELSRSGAPRSRIRRLEELSAWLDFYLN